MEKYLIEDSINWKLYSTITNICNHTLCMALTCINYIFNLFQKTKTAILTPKKTFIYKPPPSIFETLAIWTGVLEENGTENDEWVSQKLFMLASSTIFLMLFLYYGHNWLASLWKVSDTDDFRTLKKNSIKSKYNQHNLFASRQNQMENE